MRKACEGLGTQFSIGKFNTPPLAPMCQFTLQSIVHSGPKGGSRAKISHLNSQLDLTSSVFIYSNLLRFQISTRNMHIHSNWNHLNLV